MSLEAILPWVKSFAGTAIRGISSVLRRRHTKDRWKLANAFREIQTCVIATQKSLFKSLGESTSPDAVVGLDVCRTVLTAMQKSVSDFAGSAALISLKFVPEKDDGAFFCLYPVEEAIPGKLHELARELNGIDVKESFAGKAINKKDTIFVPNLWSLKDNHNPLRHETKTVLRRHGINGLVVSPVTVRISESQKPVAAVLKIDFERKNGIVDNQASRDLLAVLCEFIGFGLSIAYRYSDLRTEIRNEINRDSAIAEGPSENGVTDGN